MGFLFVALWSLGCPAEKPEGPRAALSAAGLLALRTSLTRAPVASAPARDLFGVVGEPAFRGDEASTVTGGLANGPAARALQVVDVRILGHTEKHEVVENRVRADEQIAGEARVRFIVLKLILVHRENSGELSRQLYFLVDAKQTDLPG